MKTPTPTHYIVGIDTACGRDLTRRRRSPLVGTHAPALVTCKVCRSSGAWKDDRDARLAALDAGEPAETGATGVRVWRGDHWARVTATKG